MDPQRLVAFSPVFTAECAVAVHSRPTLAITMKRESDHNPFWMRRTFWIVLYFCFWIGSLIVSIADAIPYGGSGGGAIKLWIALTGLFIFWVAFLIVRALLAPIFHLLVGHATESIVNTGAEIENQQSVGAVAMCKHCHTETPLTDPYCAWCGERFEHDG